MTSEQTPAPVDTGTVTDVEVVYPDPDTVSVGLELYLNERDTPNILGDYQLELHVPDPESETTHVVRVSAENRPAGTSTVVSYPGVRNTRQTAGYTYPKRFVDAETTEQATAFLIQPAIHPLPWFDNDMVSLREIEQDLTDVVDKYEGVTEPSDALHTFLYAHELQEAFRNVWIRNPVTFAERLIETVG